MNTKQQKPLKIKITIEDAIVCTVYRPPISPEKRGQYVVEEHVGQRMNFDRFIYAGGYRGEMTPAAMGGTFESRFDMAMCRKGS